MAASKLTRNLQTIEQELRDMIFEYVADADETRFVLGRKLVNDLGGGQDHDSGEDGRYRSAFRENFFSSVVQHPLSRTCRQFRGEFPHGRFSRAGQTYDLIVNNFDLNQMQAFARCRYKVSLGKVSTRLCYQMDCNVTTSVDDLRQALVPQAWGCLELPYELPVLADLNFRMLFDYRDPWTNISNEHKTMSVKQAETVIAAYEDIRYWLDLSSGSKGERISRLFNRFKELLNCRR